MLARLREMGAFLTVSMEQKQRMVREIFAGLVLHDRQLVEIMSKAAYARCSRLTAWLASGSTETTPLS